MILVVFIHSYREKISYVGKNVILLPPQWLEYLKYMISEVIARTAVPMFFVMSAILLYRCEFTWKENMRKKVRTILIPYLVLNTFWILFFYVAQQLEFAVPYFVTYQSRIQDWGIEGWLDAYFGNVLDAYPLLYPTWFLRDLFILNLFALLIKKCVDTVPRVSLFLVLCLWMIPLPIPFIGERGVSGQSLVFFVLGYYLVKYRADLRRPDDWSMWLVSGIYVVCVLVTMLSIGQVLHYMFRHITIFVGIVFFYKCGQWIEESRGREFCVRFSKHSFFIFAFHEMNLTIVTKLLAEKIPQTWQIQLAEYFLLPMLIIIGCVLLSILMKACFPRGYRVLTGGRGIG